MNLEIASRRNIPLHRLGTPEEVAGVIVLLCSQYAAYVTGATLEVGGGKHAYV